jgi:hypothetical protein
MVVVTPTGLLVGDPNHADGLFLHGQPGGYPVRYEALEASLTAQAGKHSANYFSGKEAVALVRVRQIQQVTRGFFTYECDSIGWVVGFGAQVPRFVDVNAGMLGCDWARAGDSLLVPVHEDQALDRVTLPGCSGALLVKRGYLPGLGVPLVFLSYALRMGPNGLEVRPFVGEE